MKIRKLVGKFVKSRLKNLLWNIQHKNKVNKIVNLKKLQNELTELSEKVDRNHSEDELKRLEDVRNKLD